MEQGFHVESIDRTIQHKIAPSDNGNDKHADENVPKARRECIAHFSRMIIPRVACYPSTITDAC